MGMFSMHPRVFTDISRNRTRSRRSSVQVRRRVDARINRLSISSSEWPVRSQCGA